MTSHEMQNFSSKPEEVKVDGNEEISIDEKGSRELELGRFLTDEEKAKNRKHLNELIAINLNKTNNTEEHKEKMAVDNQRKIDKIRESIQNLLN